jgi:hypothetical protein
MSAPQPLAEVALGTFGLPESQLDRKRCRY